MNHEAKTIEELMLKVRLDVGFDAMLDTICNGMEKPAGHRQMEPMLFAKLVYKAIKWVSLDGKTFVTVEQATKAAKTIEDLLETYFKKA